MISAIVRDYYCRIFGYCSKHYIFKKFFRWWTVPLIMDQLYYLPHKSDLFVKMVISKLTSAGSSRKAREMSLEF